MNPRSASRVTMYTIRSFRLSFGAKVRRKEVDHIQAIDNRIDRSEGVISILLTTGQNGRSRGVIADVIASAGSRGLLRHPDDDAKHGRVRNPRVTAECTR